MKLKQIINRDYLVLCSGKKAINFAGAVEILDKDIQPSDNRVKNIAIKYRNVIIGISSPKQNILATEIASSGSAVENIYCLGAAVDIILIDRVENNPNLITFLKLNPMRTAFKILQTLKNLLVLVLIKEKRTEFKKFVNFVNWI